jgi:hypothetical protein
MKFKTATDFRKSLEIRIQGIAAKTGQDLQSLRRKVAFDRLLARIFSDNNSTFFLKGGYAMELRVAEARVTKDIDLTCLQRATNENDLLSEIILDELQQLANLDLNDFFSYQIGKAQLDLDNAPYGGSRYPVSTLIDGKLFVRFQLDVGADVVVDEIEQIKGVDWLEFCGVKAPVIPTISIEQQLSEKLHAYSLPCGDRINSRAKDLIDMVLLLNMREIKKEEFQKVLEKVFKARKTHPLPKFLDPPPQEWEIQFKEMAAECGIVQDMRLNFEKVSLFYNPITKEKWQNANQILDEFGNLIAPYTVILAFGESGSYGTAVLIKYKDKRVLLTATHVARQLKKAKTIRLILRFDDRRRVYPTRDPRDFEVKEWDLSFDDEMLQDVLGSTPKDLAIIELSPQISNMLENYKQFYQLIEPLNIKSEDTLVSYGGIGSEKMGDTLSGMVYSLVVVMSNYEKQVGSDYIVSKVSTETFGIKNFGEKAISNFQGLCGGGLWKIVNQKPQLVGIAIAQDLTGFIANSEGLLYFHGPESISAMLKSLDDE